MTKKLVIIAIMLIFAALPAMGEFKSAEEILAGQTGSQGGDKREAVRREFKALFDTKLNRFVMLTQDTTDSGKVLRQQTRALLNALRTVDVWERVEVALRVNGTHTPDAVVHQIADAVDKIHTHATKISEQATQILKPEVPADVRDLKSIRAELVKVPELLLKTAVFLRDTELADNRARYVVATRSYEKFLDFSVPDSLEALDAANRDVATMFNVVVQDAMVRDASRQTVTLDEKSAMRAFLVDYYTKFVTGDLKALKPLFAGEYWPETELKTATQKFKDWRLGEIGKIDVQALDADKFEVTVTEIRFIQRDSEVTNSRDILVLGRAQEADYQVVYLGSARSRTNNEKEKNREKE